MQNVFTTVGAAWSFYRSQPVLNHVLLWLLALPLTIMLLIGGVLEGSVMLMPQTMLIVEDDPALIILSTLVNIGLAIVLTWGMASILVVGKRLLQSRAGRARSSFRTVRKQAGLFVVNLFLTNILRDCFIFFWALIVLIPLGFILATHAYAEPQNVSEAFRLIRSTQVIWKILVLPFLLPAVVYAIQTFFYSIAIVAENKGYRSALHRSQEVVKGHTWQVLLNLLGISLLTVIPVMIFTSITTQFAEGQTSLAIPVIIIHAFALSIGIVLFILSSVILYGNVQKPAASKVK